MKDKNKKQSYVSRYGLLIIVFIAALLLIFTNPSKGQIFQETVRHYFLEMLSFIPPVFLLTALIDVWVPRHIVENNVGPESGLKGIIVTIITAASAAGPLYIAFPLVLTLYRKGAKLSNVVLFINTWATIKIPMVLNEIRFVGFDFAMARLLLTLPAIIIISIVAEKAVGKIETSPEAQYSD